MIYHFMYGHEPADANQATAQEAHPGLRAASERRRRIGAAQ
jgi:hypothetical protein